jgi:mannose-6-phosphate isomerase-like protein (cupin superfamily)
MQRTTSMVTDNAARSWFVERVAESLSDPRNALVERGARGGEMAPLHVRREDETYRVVEGRVTFFVGAETVSAGAGDVVVAPAGVARTARVESTSARWLVLTRVDSLSRFEDFGRAFAAPADEWPSLEEVASLSAIAVANGIDVVGPPGALPA